MVSKTSGEQKRQEFIRRLLIAVSVVTATALLVLVGWKLASAALLVFAGVLFAILLRAPTNLLVRHTRLRESWALGLVVVFFVSIFWLAGWLMALPISEQAAELSRQLPRAIQQLRAQMEQYALGKIILDWLAAVDTSSEAGNVLGKIGNIFTITAEAITGLFFILFTGLFLAARPAFYLNGFIRLLPVPKRERGKEVLLEMGTKLRSWLWGQLLAMLMVGVLTWVALLLLKIPLAGVLGILAGLFDFIPFVGPFLAAVPAVLLGFLQGPQQAAYVLAAFLTVQFIESHLIIPLAQRQSSELPPVLTLVGMVAFSMLFGFLGMLLATPLMVALLVFIQMVYVADVLEK